MSNFISNKISEGPFISRSGAQASPSPSANASQTNKSQSSKNNSSVYVSQRNRRISDFHNANTRLEEKRRTSKLSPEVYFGEDINKTESKANESSSNLEFKSSQKFTSLDKSGAEFKSLGTFQNEQRNCQNENHKSGLDVENDQFLTSESFASFDSVPDEYTVFQNNKPVSQQTLLAALNEHT